MRVLLLRRQSFGGIATHTGQLAEGLRERGVEVEIEEADWIPDRTGGKFDKNVSERLRKVAKGCDLVHAFGYRAAWACSAAFGSDEAWLYSAWDMPKTTHPILIGKLNDCTAGLCSSRAVYGALDEAIAIHLQVVKPGVTPQEIPRPREELRRELGLDETSLAVGAMGRYVPERGFDALIEAMNDVWPAFEEAHLLLAGKGPAEDDLKAIAMGARKPERIRFFGSVSDPLAFLGALDLLVVPSRRAGTSMVALEGMSLGVPVLLRHTGGLPELIDEDISGMTFNTDASLASRINEMLGLPLTLETLARAARVRVEEHFRLDDTVDRIERIYRSIGS
ncbi:MAG TPA: glycosyltransferase family 4 protein [Fimbriimonadaceae bacterium]|nr:glycosyltransferase family 4 protein [Fimbriimonadaceae bacterium]